MIPKVKEAEGAVMRMTLPRDFAKIRALSGRVRRFLLKHRCSEQTRADVELALVEACNNAIQHAPSEVAPQPVIVEVWIGRAEIELRVIDHGPGFSWPGEIELPDPEMETGRGLYLIRRVMDSVRYERGAGKNALVLRRKRRRTL